MVVNRDELKQKREADSRVALLGLVADKLNAQQGSCLLPEEMAELLDGKCAADQKRLYFTHLSICDTCYGEWLNLQQELISTTVEQKKPLLFQRWFLRVSGSLLAAAASVVFYLNLDTDPGPQETSVFAAPQLERKQAPEMLKSPVQQKSVENLAAPAPVKKSKPQFDAATVDSVLESVEQEFTTAPARQMSLRSEAMVPEMALDPVQQWIDQIQKKCSEENVGQAIWQELAGQGKELALMDTFLQLENIVERVRQLAGGENQKAVCAEIKQILTDENQCPKNKLNYRTE